MATDPNDPSRRPGLIRMTLVGLAALPMSSGACLGGYEVLSTSASASTSPAEDNEESDTDGFLITGAVLLGLTIVGTVSAFTEGGDADFSYLQEHQQEVRVALARGDGAFVTDLGQQLDLPSAMLPHLGAVLRAARPALEPPVDHGPVTRDDADVFARELVRALHDDALIAPYLDRALTIAVEASNAR